MLPAANRVDSREVIRLLRSGRVATSPPFAVRYGISGSHPAKFAIIVPKRTDKRASARNSIRRQISESIRKHVAEFPPGLTAVVTVRGKLPETQDMIASLLLSLYSKDRI